MTLTHSRSRRSVVLGAGTLVIASLVLAGCGRSDTAAPAAAAAIDDEPATGVVEFWAGSPDGDQLPELIAQFEEENPDVEVNVTTVSSTDFDTKLTTAIASGTVPDMVFLYSQTQTSMLATDAFAPVPDDLVDPESFFESSYDETLKDGVSYAVPWYAYANLYFYRKDLVEAAGAELPTTWDELETFAAEMQDAGYANPLGLNVAWDVYTAQAFNELSFENGGTLISDDLSEWTLNTPENVAALEYWAGLFEQGFASLDGPLFLDTTPWFSSGQTIMVNSGPWFPGWLDEANGEGWSDEHVGAIIRPAGEGGSHSSLSGGSLAVLDGAENADAAWKLVRWMAQPEVQVDWFDIYGNLPAVSGAWELSDDISTDPLLAPVQEAITTAVTVPQVSTWNQVAAAIAAQMERVARGETTAQEALDAAQAEAESIGTDLE
jgi:multiple sugar transport system substrate-binding protein